MKRFLLRHKQALTVGAALCAAAALPLLLVRRRKNRAGMQEGGAA